MSLNTPDYSIQLEPWYSPKEVINHYGRMQEVFRDRFNHATFKRAREMIAGAIAVTGAWVLSKENRFLIQANNQTSTPDVMAIKQLEHESSRVSTEISQLEIVEFGPHSNTNSIIDFLSQTKLKPNKAYDENITLVCVINKEILIEHSAVTEAIKSLPSKPQSTIYITGATKDPDEYIIYTPFPKATKIFVYNLHNILDQINLPPRVTFHLGITEKIRYEKNTSQPYSSYDVLGLKKPVVYKALNIPII
jgi:hypothetical protein